MHFKFSFNGMRHPDITYRGKKKGWRASGKQEEIGFLLFHFCGEKEVEMSSLSL